MDAMAIPTCLCTSSPYFSKTLDLCIIWLIVSLHRASSSLNFRTKFKHLGLNDLDHEKCLYLGWNDLTKWKITHSHSSLPFPHSTTSCTNSRVASQKKQKTIPSAPPPLPSFYPGYESPGSPMYCCDHFSLRKRRGSYRISRWAATNLMSQLFSFSYTIPPPEPNEIQILFILTFLAHLTI